MRLTKEKAIESHHQMWKEMKEEFGDNAKHIDRLAFKKKWIERHFPNEEIAFDCFLCKYTWDNSCSECQIVWDEENCVFGRVSYE